MTKEIPSEADYEKIIAEQQLKILGSDPSGNGTGNGKDTLAPEGTTNQGQMYSQMRIVYPEDRKPPWLKKLIIIDHSATTPPELPPDRGL